MASPADRLRRRLAQAKFHRNQLDQLIPALEKAIEAEESLKAATVKSRVNTNMHADHRLAISEGRAKRDKKFKDTIRNAKPRRFTQAALANALGMKESLLSMCRSGERAMYLSRAKRIEELTGWPADKAHWPGGLIEDA